jgi:methylated-DNA-[protein]-cysteine S-methyltransferase
MFGEKIQRLLKGEKVDFDLELLDFSGCFPIQKLVLLAEFKIPRGWVSTYKRIANHLGIPQGARVVGNALAKNPFPIIIPCHRVIKVNGKLGGFQGGVDMKRALLELEGIEISDKGKVITDRFYY